MQEITFQCEVITPMFLSGADGKTPELRAPSIKGALRFWWRAINGHLSIDKLREEEAKIFGGSGDYEGRSRVVIRVRPSRVSQNDKIRYQPLPHHDNDGFCDENKCERNKNGACKKSFSLEAVSPELNFTVELSFYENNDINQEKLENLFILVSILGGLGKRVRRGFGCFKINKIDNVNFSESIDLNYISGLLNSVNIADNNCFEIENNKITSNFNLNHFPYIKEIKIGNGVNNYDDLLIKIGKSSHSNNSNYTGFANGDNKLSSPIYVSVIKRNNKYFPIVTILETISNKLEGKDKSLGFISEVLS